MVLGITADENDDENDKENLIRRREMVRATRLEKESVFDEGDMRHRSRGGGDIVTRWRDKKQPSPDRVSNKQYGQTQLYGKFALSLGKESRHIFSKFNPLNTDTLLLRTIINCYYY